MSLCSHCRSLPRFEDKGSVFYLTHPLAHTRHKLRTELAHHYAVSQPTADSLAVVLPPGTLDAAAEHLESSLSVAEREDCKTLLLAQGETLDLSKLSQVQPLTTFLAKLRSG